MVKNTVLTQQKWNNTYLKATFNQEGGNIANFCFQDKELMTIITVMFF